LADRPRPTKPSTAAGGGDVIDYTTVVTKDPGYALSASSDHEHERLRRQAERLAPFTRRLLTRAGIKPGMRVLDVGCGPGDVSFLVSELVGGDGSVIAIERDPDAVAAARARAAESETTNIEFVHGDFRDIELADGPFDALVGRLVLMYQSDPTAAVSAAVRHLRPGGVAAFAEMSMRLDPPEPERISWPRTNVLDQTSRWVYAAFAGMGTQPDMGLRLPEILAQAGLLPSPELDTHVAIATGEEAVEALVGLVRSMLPAILASEVASEQEVEIDTLAERVRDTGAIEPIVMWPIVIGAHAAKPE
jgi:SAM-dependent methyltransferase